MILTAKAIARAAVGALLSLFMAQSALAASAVVVLHGDEALADAGERRFAKSLANHAVRWMRDGGVVADIASDRDIPGVLSGRKVAVLVHCAEPTSRQISAYRSFVAKGGRLIVTYSSSPALADIVGVRVGKYRRDPSRVAMSFPDAGRPPNVAPLIRQSSPNIVEAFAIPGRSRVLAWWADNAGRLLADAAWLAGDGGYWMTHVLLADGDAAQKGTLLLALAAEAAPALWRTAAEARIAAAPHVGSWSTLKDANLAVQRQRDPTRRTRVTGEVNSATSALNAARGALSAGRGADAWHLASEARRHLECAYGLAQSPRQGEIRAVWDHSGCGLYPGDWPRTCRELSESGITDIFINSASPMAANCNISSVPRSANYQRFGDQLAACLAAARPYGIRVHAWLFCFSTTGATADRRESFRKAGWLVDSTNGTQQDWLDPSSAAVRSKVTAIATEIMSKYRIDGLHLDFVRYQDYYNSLGYGTKTRFSRDELGGKVPANWTDAAKKAPLMGQVMRWRTRQVTSLVASIRAAQRRTAPGITLSAAVLGKYPACVESVGQDWMAWIEAGHIDYAMPMNYTESNDKYAELLATQLKKPSIAQRIVGGIGVTASESRLGPGQVIDQANALRARGAAGFILFDLDATLSNEILPILRLGITARPR